MAPSKPNANAYAYLNQISHAGTRQAMKAVLDQIAALQQLVTQIGTVSQPLAQDMDGGGRSIKRVQNPIDPQDVVTLSYLESYVGNYAFAQGGPGAAAGGGGAGGGGGGGGGSQTPITIPDHSDIVNAVLATFSPPLDASNPNSDLFDFARQVVWNISLLGTDPPGVNVGLLIQTAGDGVFNCAGTTYATFRIAYTSPDPLVTVAANIKILTGSYTAQWTREADIPLADWGAPVNPATPC